MKCLSCTYYKKIAKGPGCLLHNDCDTAALCTDHQEKILAGALNAARSGNVHIVKLPYKRADEASHKIILKEEVEPDMYRDLDIPCWVIQEHGTAPDEKTLLKAAIASVAKDSSFDRVLWLDVVPLSS